MNNYLGENLRKIRKLYERKQSDIASCIGISTRQYRKMENDEVAVRDKYLLKLADCYSITIDTLREFNANRLLIKPKDKQHITISSHLAKVLNTQNKEQHTQEYYEELLAAKENIIQSQREFITFLTSKRKEQA